MSALKTATNNLLTQLHAAATTNGDVYVSIVPFAKDVNVDAANRNATWVDWTGWDGVTANAATGSTPLKAPARAPGRTWTTKNHNTWNGCVTNRGVRAPRIPATTTPTLSRLAAALPRSSPPSSIG